ncbi:MAG: DUF2752 domain-containing protein [Candidatus Aminicenantes bacterium]|nr:MAG: DUF2752 domain-containing protein [Candidatus Aminicenantes bacterium]
MTEMYAAKKHLYILILSVAALLFSRLLQVERNHIYLPPEFKESSAFALSPVPGFCLFKEVSGWDCPFCGLTRSFVSTSHLRFKDAWNFNRAGLLIYIMVLFQVPFRLYLIWRAQKQDLVKMKKNQQMQKLLMKVCMYLVGTALGINWLYNIVHRI